eukprot:CAMPEP_0206427124 /NCGR_PEP_ID=MMETSP0324_2-20121206/4835_1 /ASSEMBLY_ACC=CAM_ASM_000836 /TAXON_ID=2866 /ORGANISM="Crypthecodinium cohnii, Strain Seligo" /LENGTH=759 /DNA_ID=CAMNT_0053892307 /DNA_START=135 /DNA_END=2415 /DNA_ORIENTATION=+
MADHDQDIKLAQLIDSLGQDCDSEVLRAMLEVNDWNVEATLVQLTEGAGPPPGDPHIPTDSHHVDADGYRAPMRTGYHDRLLPGPGEDELEQALLASRAMLGDGRRHRDHRDRKALARSAREAEGNEMMQIERMAQARREEEEAFQRAIEESYRESKRADALYREQLRAAEEASLHAAEDRSAVAEQFLMGPTSIYGGGGGIDSPPPPASVPSTASGSRKSPLPHPPSGAKAPPASRVAASESFPPEKKASQHRSVDRDTYSSSSSRPSSTPSNQKVSTASSARTGTSPSFGRGNSGLSRVSPESAPRRPTQQSAAAAGPSRNSFNQGKRPSPMGVRARTNTTPTRSHLEPHARSGSPTSQATARDRAASGSLASGGSKAGAVPPPKPQVTRLPPPTPVFDGGTSSCTRPSAHVAYPHSSQPSAHGQTRPHPPPTFSTSPSPSRTTPSAASDDSSRPRRSQPQQQRQSLPEQLQQQQQQLQQQQQQLQQQQQRAMEEEESRQRAEREEQRRKAAAAAAAETAAAADRARRAEEARKEAELKRRQEEEQEAARKEQQRREEAQRAEEERVRREAEEEKMRQEALKAQDAERRRQALLDAERRAREAAAPSSSSSSPPSKEEDAEAQALKREREEAQARMNESEEGATATNLFVQALLTLRKRYKDSDPGGLKTCLQTLRAYIKNIVDNPVEPKFHRINCENGAFKNRIASFAGAQEVLEALGFVLEASQLMVTPSWVSTNRQRLWEALSKVNVMLDQMQQ